MLLPFSAGRPVANRVEGDLDLALLRRALIPSRAKHVRIGAKLISVRGETVAEKPAFKRAVHFGMHSCRDWARPCVSRPVQASET